MSQTVVLVRHGEAKGKKLGQTDFERELTKKGAKALEKAFPQTFARLSPTQKSELWVSTAVRARQTAQIANKTLGIETVRELPFLYDQDDRAFMDELAQSQGHADLIVVVGHIPFMEDACFLLTQAYQGFSTGAAAAVQLDDNLHGKLLWFEQGPCA
ncbi:MAG: histidine phosphatase family protein [Coriobacteriales bacterium]|nr:histidine phosphatase family protein [Coriobacteriales bacterium]